MPTTSTIRSQVLRWFAISTCVAAVGLSALPARAGEISDQEFARLTDQLRLKNQPWASASWKVNVTEARRAAHAQRKPVFLVVNTGNCLGFVCGNGVIAREAVLNDARVAELLRTKLVPMGLDNVEHPNLTAAERAFLDDKGLKFCTQGMSVFTASGKVLAMGGGFEPDGVLNMLNEALAKFDPDTEPADIEPLLPKRGANDKSDKSVVRTPPEGGLELYVTWKVLGGFEKPQGSSTTGDGHYDRDFARSLGVDRLWVRKDEAAALAAGRLPVSLLKRVAPHVSYVTDGDVKEWDLSLRGGKLAGSFLSDTGDRSAVHGRVESDGGKVTKLTMVVTGKGTRVEDCGFGASLTIVPKGIKVPVAVLFELADPADDLSRVTPIRANHEGYLD